MKATRAIRDITSLRRQATAHGATLDESTKAAGFINVDAPAGTVWASSLTHSLCVNWGDPGHRYGQRADAQMKAEAIRDALERMKDGLLACDIVDCDVCEENRSEESR